MQRTLRQHILLLYLTWKSMRVRVTHLRRRAVSEVGGAMVGPVLRPHWAGTHSGK